MNNIKHNAPEIVPLHHREVEKSQKKHHSLLQTTLDTTPEKHISYASEPHHIRAKRRKLASFTTTFLLIILFLTIASIFIAAFFSMWITNNYKQMPPYENLSPTPQITSVIPSISNKTISVNPLILSQDEKELIDIWLADKRKTLNNFGDAIDTTYAGGTPLFDETIGKTINRYDYIVANHPDRPWNK